MKTKREYIKWFLLLSSWLPLFAQDAGSSTKLEVSKEEEPTSFFRVQAVKDRASTLLWDSHNDKPTSKWRMTINGKNFDLKNSHWKPVIKESEAKYLLPYSDMEYVVEQVLEFFGERRYGKLTLRFTNNSGEKLKLKPILLLDTRLGEKAHTPFRLADGSLITAETEFRGRDVPDRVIMSEGDDGISLTLEFGPSLPVRPERIVMANYYRLNAKPVGFIVHKARDFMSHHHINQNDSAILLEYKEVEVSGKESVEFPFIFGLGAEASSVNELPPEEAPPEETPAKDLQPIRDSLNERLRLINGLIDEIDVMVREKSGITEESVSGIETRVREQEKLRREYESP